MSKFIFVTGGVISSLGKGLTSAAIGLLLERRGLGIRLQKIDPYINVDPGTMSPFQHGEVYVTEDGAETDLDLGHYERFTSRTMSKQSNVTTGQIYQTVIERERCGDYLGKTVQVVPHITDEIKRRIRKLAGDGVDVIQAELGGTVGDIEGLPFLEAIRQIRHEVGRENSLFIHLTLIPYIRAAGEVKTKPTQHSVGKLREIGIQPDILICRTEKDVTDEVREKISLFCNVEPEAVIIEKDVEHSIYELPTTLSGQKLDEVIASKLKLKLGPRNIDDWHNIVDRIISPDHTVKIAVVGKYISLQDSYKSVYEAITHGGISSRAAVEIVRVEAEELEEKGAEAFLADVDGLLVPGGFGGRGIGGKVLAIQYARENTIPFLGLCLGMQCSVIEFARNVCGIEDAHSTEFEPDCGGPVICLMEEQQYIKNMGGTMRLGSYPCDLAQGSRAKAAYGTGRVSERHRHRYEFNNRYRSLFESRGMVFSGLSPDGLLVEIVELRDHPFFVATQAHPEFKSRPTAAHPLFREFVKAALERKVATVPAVSKGGGQ